MIKKQELGGLIYFSSYDIIFRISREMGIRSKFVFESLLPNAEKRRRADGCFTQTITILCWIRPCESGSSGFYVRKKLQIFEIPNFL